MGQRSMNPSFSITCLRSHSQHFTDWTLFCGAFRALRSASWLCLVWLWSWSTPPEPPTTWPSWLSRTTAPSPPRTTGTTSQTRWDQTRTKTEPGLKQDWIRTNPGLVVFKADLCSSMGDPGFVVFGLVLFVWELLPTALAVFFFRVRKPPQHTVSTGHGLNLD